MDKLTTLVVLACKNGRYKPTIVGEISKGLFFKSPYVCYADLDFLYHEKGKILVAFREEYGEVFSHHLEELKETHPILYGAIVQHLHDIKHTVMV